MSGLRALWRRLVIWTTGRPLWTRVVRHALSRPLTAQTSGKLYLEARIKLWIESREGSGRLTVVDGRRVSK